MSCKTIMVHMDTSASANARLALALRLARGFGAHLEGLFARFEPNPREFHVMGGTAAYYDTHRTLRMEQRGAIERLFRAEVSRAQIVRDRVTEGFELPVFSLQLVYQARSGGDRKSVV